MDGGEGASRLLVKVLKSPYDLIIDGASQDKVLL
jgi:hypothetical protein